MAVTLMNPMNALRLMVARAAVNLINDAGGLQVLQINALASETVDGVERVQNYGLTSHPPRGSTAIAVAVGGNRNHLVAIAVDDEASRPRELEEGEVALYNNANAQQLLDRDGNIRIRCRQYVIDADEVVINAPVTHTQGNLASHGKVLHTHKHKGVVPGGGISEEPL